MKQRPQVEIVHSFYWTGEHKHHNMKHYIKDNAPVFVNSVSALLQQQTVDHFHEVPFFNRLCRGASIVE